MFKKIVLVLLSTGLFISAQQHPLPRALQGKSITHHVVRQLDAYSCGYNALFNACRIESEHGRANRHSNYRDFEAVCNGFLPAIGQGKKESSSNEILDALAPQIGLQHYHYLDFYDNQVSAIFSTPTRFSVRHGASFPEIEQIEKQAVKNRSNQRLNELRKAWNSTPRGQACIISFLCQTTDQGGNHAILLSVIKDKAGVCSIHICDNLNMPLRDESQITTYALWAHTFFGLNQAPAQHAPQPHQIIPDAELAALLDLFYQEGDGAVLQRLTSDAEFDYFYSMLNGA